MNITNLHNLPEAIVNAVKNDPYSAGNSDISVTKLIDSPQLRVLRKRHANAIVEDVTERIWSLLGQAVHTILERADQGENVIAEDRLYADVDGWKLSGQFDRCDLHNTTLDDYKVTSTYKVMMDSHIEWERQLNCLRWLAIQNGYKVDKLRIVAILRDHRKSDVLRKPGYPPMPVHVIDIPVWDLGETHEYIRNRIWVHKNSEAGEIPLFCTPEETWYSGDKFAVMKQGGKRAIKIYERREDAEQGLADGYFVEERKGIYRRCAEYCEVANFCEQWRSVWQDTSSSIWSDSGGDGGDW